MIIKINLEELQLLVKNKNMVKIKTPTGYEKITETYEKFGEGFELKFDDGAILKSASAHKIYVNSRWVKTGDFLIGDIIDSRTIVDKIKVSPQKWIDFTIDAPHHSYYHKNILHHNSGKSLVIYSIIRILIESGKKILLITPTTMLVDQLLKDFQDYEVNDNFGIENYSHKVYAGLSKTSEKPLIISTWQSIDSVPKDKLAEFLSEYDAVIVDESHTAQAKSLRNILEKCVNAKIKVGFTGTLIDAPTHYYVLVGLFGTPKKVISIKELMDSGKIAKLTIKCIVLQYPEGIRKQVHKFVDRNKNIRPMEYDEELDFVINYENRNKFIANLADKLEGNTLTIIRFIEKHANVLKEYYDAKNNKKTYLITGDVAHDEKTLIKENMEFETNANLMGSWGLVSTGMSIINLNNGIFASPSASEIRVLQAIGRILRKGTNKTTATQYDIVDCLTYEGRHNYMMRHFQQRLKYYRREGFNVEIIQVNIS